MKRILLFFLTTFIFTIAKSESNDNITLDFYGFVRVDAYMDTYKGVDAAHDLFYLLPAYSVINKAEINNRLSSNITATASRLGVKINFPEVLYAKATGILEFDFVGNLKADPTLFRIRQAYSLLTWEKSSLLVGQTWHPFFSGTCMPTVAGLNTGAPFSCFNRSPLIRYDMKLGNLTLSATAISQMQYNTPSIDAEELKIVTFNQAKRNGIIPELVLSTEWMKESITLGAGIGYNTICPRMMVTGNPTDSTTVSSVADQYLGSSSGMLYGRYKKDKLTILLKGYCGENMAHLTMPGAYGIATKDLYTGKETYTNYITYTSSLNIVYGQKWQVGLFAGYGGNLGTKESLWDSGGGKAKVYGLFSSLQSMYRVAPHISLNLSKFRLVGELEVTGANYGAAGSNINLSNGLYENTHNVVNKRFIVVMTQYF